MYICGLNTTFFYIIPEFSSHTKSLLTCYKREAQLFCWDAIDLIHSLTELRCLTYHSLIRIIKSSGCLFECYLPDFVYTNTESI